MRCLTAELGGMHVLKHLQILDRICAIPIKRRKEIGALYRADWKPAAASRRHVFGVGGWVCVCVCVWGGGGGWGGGAGVLEVPSGIVGTIYTKSNSDFMESPYFESFKLRRGHRFMRQGIAIKMDWEMQSRWIGGWVDRWMG